MSILDHLFAPRSIDGGPVRSSPTEGGARRDGGDDHRARACELRRWRAQTEGSVFDAYRRWGIR